MAKNRWIKYYLDTETKTDTNPTLWKADWDFE